MKHNLERGPSIEIEEARGSILRSGPLRLQEQPNRVPFPPGVVSVSRALWPWPRSVAVVRVSLDDSWPQGSLRYSAQNVHASALFLVQNSSAPLQSFPRATRAAYARARYLVPFALLASPLVPRFVFVREARSRCWDRSVERAFVPRNVSSMYVNSLSFFVPLIQGMTWILQFYLSISFTWQ